MLHGHAPAQDAHKLEQHVPGVVAVTTASVGRYSEFHIAMTQLQVPSGTVTSWRYGVNFARQCNLIIQNMPSEAEWVWFIDDDHVFAPDILLRLLTGFQRAYREAPTIDIVCPLVLQSGPPYEPVMYRGQKDGWKAYGGDAIQGRQGLVEVEACGKAGMLVRREVFEKMSSPWFEFGRTAADVGGMDLWFCEKARQAGFKIYVDTDVWMGHITHLAVWPTRDADNTYGAEFRRPLNISLET